MKDLDEIDLKDEIDEISNNIEKQGKLEEIHKKHISRRHPAVYRASLGPDEYSGLVSSIINEIAIWKESIISNLTIALK